MADTDIKKKSRKKKSTSKTAEAADPQDNIISSDSIKKSTKATFDLYLEQAQANVARERKSSPKKPKSKKQKEGEEVLLENLRNSSEFQKDKDEETKKRNTFNPDDSKEKSNKRRDRTSKSSAKSGRPPRAQSGVNNPAYEDERRVTGVISPPGTGADQPMTIDELSATVKKSKTKRGKKKTKQDQEMKEDLIEEQENPSPDKPHKVKKGKQPKGGSADVEGDDITHKAATAAEYEKYTDEDKIAGVIIHRADKLRTNFLLQHPLIRVHIIDSETGQYLNKQDKDRPVTSFYETQKRDQSLESILPMMTQAFDFKEMRTVIPWWDEMLVFNENFNYLLQDYPKVIVFFEVLDFVSMNRASKNQTMRSGVRGEEGWHKEAWGFLKLRGANGKLNVDKQLRLQLYEVPRLSRHNRDEYVPVYQYWKYSVRRSYPSSLYVSIKSILAPETVEPAVRSMFPTQEERGTMTMKQIQEALSKTQTKTIDDLPVSNWSRLPGQMCKLPNSMLLSLPAGKMGCLVMKFSHNGRFLACGCNDKSSNPILIYEIPGGELKATLNGHYNNIYEINWSKSDKFLLTASSDGTARVWDAVSGKCYKMLPHPTFVYSAKFHPRVSKVIVTGSYDNTVRVWHIDGTDIQASLQQELDGHESYINSLCFDEEGTKLYSADNMGIIKIWNVYVTEKATKKGVTRDWQLNSTIDNEEMKDLSISHMSLHPNGRRLLIHSKDNTIRMLDLRMMSVTQRYVGALNFRELVHSDISPCGTFVFSGSEDGCAYVWNTDTGDQVAVYSELNYTQAVNDVKFHPLDHIVAFSSRGDNHKVLIFKYEYNLAEREAKNYFTLVPRSGGAATANDNRHKELLTNRQPLEKRIIDKLDRELMKYLMTSQPGSVPCTVQDKVHLSTLLTKYHHSLPSDDEVSATQRRGGREDISLLIETKKQRAMRKLESVMGETAKEFNRAASRQTERHPDPSAMMSSTTAPPGVVTGTMSGLATGTWNSTGGWGSTFDTNYSQSNIAPTLGPTIMSPHARQNGDTEAMRSHLTSQMEYMRKNASGGTWRPGFTPVGSRTDRAPIMSLSAPSEENPVSSFTLQGADDMKPIGEVVALYDYMAQRSDELTFRKNNIISILYKDTEQWWMGMLKSTGAQGFLPSNYVESVDGGNLDEYQTSKQATSYKTPKGKKKTTTTALVDERDGELKFISGTESDASSGDNLDRPKKRRSMLGDRRRKGRHSHTADRRSADRRSTDPQSFDHLLV